MRKRTQQQSEQMAFCVQCQTFLPIMQMDVHCSKCIQDRIVQLSQIDMISQQLHNIKSIAQRAMNKCSEDEEKYKFLIRIHELCLQIDSIQGQNFLSAKKLEDLQSEINVLISYQQTSMTVLMLLNRLLILIQEKLLLLQKRRLMTQKSFPFTNSSRMKTDSQYDDDDSQYNYRRFQSEQSIKRTSEFKRNFYSKCLEMKIQLPKNHPAQQLLVSELFSIVTRKNYNNEQAIRFMRNCFMEGKINQV